MDYKELYVHKEPEERQVTMVLRTEPDPPFSVDAWLDKYPGREVSVMLTFSYTDKDVEAERKYTCVARQTKNGYISATVAEACSGEAFLEAVKMFNNITGDIYA